MAMHPDQYNSNKGFSTLIEYIMLEEARISCVDIYKDFSWEEVEKMSPSIQECWKVGCKFEGGGDE